MAVSSARRLRALVEVPFVAPEIADLPDQDLCDIVRSGPSTTAGRVAFATIYERHVDAAMAQAFAMTGDKSESEDLVSETFLRVLRALSNRNGPKESVRGYVLISLRSTAIRLAQLDYDTDVLEPESVAEIADRDATDFSDELSERDQVGRAFLQLAENHRRVLWLLDVEETPIPQAAEHLQMSEGSVRVLAHRARKKLATSYLQQYVDSAAPGCEKFTTLLAANLRNELGSRASKEVTAHLDGCAACTAQTRRLARLAQHLRAWAGPIVAGGTISGLLVAADATSASAATVGLAKVGKAGKAKAASVVGIAAGVAVIAAGAVALWPQPVGVAPSMQMIEVEEAVPTITPPPTPPVAPAEPTVTPEPANVPEPEPEPDPEPEPAPMPEPVAPPAPQPTEPVIMPPGETDVPEDDTSEDWVEQ